jgi:hypothetical protein
MFRPMAGPKSGRGEAMNDADYQSTLECLRIAMRLITPLDLDGFLKRVETSESSEPDGESRLSIRRLARLARAMREEAGAAEDSARSLDRGAHTSAARAW